MTTRRRRPVVMTFLSISHRACCQQRSARQQWCAGQPHQLEVVLSWPRPRRCQQFGGAGAVEARPPPPPPSPLRCRRVTTLPSHKPSSLRRRLKQVGKAEVKQTMIRCRWVRTESCSSTSSSARAERRGASCFTVGSSIEAQLCTECGSRSKPFSSCTLPIGRSRGSRRRHRRRLHHHHRRLLRRLVLEFLPAHPQRRPWRQVLR